MSRIEEIETRLSAIKAELETEGADINALSAETDLLLEERKKLLDEVETRKHVLAKVATLPAGKTIDNEEEKKMDEKRIMTAESKEYRNAFLKFMAGYDITAEERSVLDKVNEETRTAFTHTTGTTSGQTAGYLVPTTTIDKIWDLMEEEHAILRDISIYRTGTIIEVTKRTAITAGDAGTVSEGSAPSSDENNTFAKVTLSGKDFAKDVEISYALGIMAIDAFEDFLSNEIGERLGSAIASDIISQLGTDFDSTHNDLDVASSGKIGWADVTNAFAVLKNAKGVSVYGSRTTIYKYVAGMVDTTGRPIFQANANEGIEGYLFGAPVKVEDAITDDILWIGDPKKVTGNMVQDVMIENDRDIKRHVIIYSGYARFQCALIAPAAFAKLDITP